MNGQQAYELFVIREGFLSHHFDFQPWLRSSTMVRMNLAPPNSQIVANTNLSDNHVAATVVAEGVVDVDHPGRTTCSRSARRARAGAISRPSTRSRR